MDDSDLYNELNNLNSNKKNKYEENWGTLLNFLDESKLDETTISKLTKKEDDNQSFLQNHDIDEESQEIRKPRNMAEVYGSLRGTADRINAFSADQLQKSPNVNYVYKPHK